MENVSVVDFNYKQSFLEKIIEKKIKKAKIRKYNILLKKSKQLAKQISKLENVSKKDPSVDDVVKNIKKIEEEKQQLAAVNKQIKLLYVELYQQLEQKNKSKAIRIAPASFKEVVKKGKNVVKEKANQVIDFAARKLNEHGYGYNALPEPVVAKEKRPEPVVTPDRSKADAMNNTVDNMINSRDLNNFHADESKVVDSKKSITESAKQWNDLIKNNANNTEYNDNTVSVNDSDISYDNTHTNSPSVNNKLNLEQQASMIKAVKAAIERQQKQKLKQDERIKEEELKAEERRNEEKRRAEEAISKHLEEEYNKLNETLTNSQNEMKKQEEQHKNEMKAKEEEHNRELERMFKDYGMDVPEEFKSKTM